jgi:hypothetical protein
MERFERDVAALPTSERLLDAKRSSDECPVAVVPIFPLNVTRPPVPFVAFPIAVMTPVPVVVVAGATPAPLPRTIAFAAKAAEDDSCDVDEKYGIPPLVPVVVSPIVPAVVIGDPVTPKIDEPGTVIPTLMTDPPPPPDEQGSPVSVKMFPVPNSTQFPFAVAPETAYTGLLVSVNDANPTALAAPRPRLVAAVDALATSDRLLAIARSSEECPVMVTPVIVPPVIATLLAFCVAIVPRPRLVLADTTLPTSERLLKIARSSVACPVSVPEAPVIATPVTVPPVIATALAFCVAIVPRPAAAPKLVPGSL